MRPDFTTLKLFLAVAELGSMSKAAEREHISVTAISKRIIELEQSLGVSLLERHSTGVRVTSAGAAVVVEVRGVLSKLDQLRGRISEYTHGEIGEVKILFSPSGPIGSLPRALRTFMQLHQRLDVHLEERRAPKVIEGVAQSEADIGIFARLESTGALAIAHQLKVRPYETLRLELVTPIDHPLATKSAISFEEAAQHDFILFTQSRGIGARLQRISHERGIQLRGRLHVTTFDSARRMVQAGLGVCVMCGTSARLYGEVMGLKSIPITDNWAEYELAICTRDDETLSKPARLMLAHLVETAQYALPPPTPA